MVRFGPRLRMLAAIFALARAGVAHAQDGFVLEVDGSETAVVTETLRKEIARLGVAPSGRLSVVRADRVATVTYVAADGRVIERTITTQRSARESAQEIALLAVSMMRDDGAPPLPDPPAEDPPSAEPATEPTPAEPVSEPPADVLPDPRAVADDVRISGSRRGGALTFADPCRAGKHSLPFGFDVFPYVGMSSSTALRDSTRGLSLNLFGGLSNGLRGLEIGSLFNVETAGVCGFQIAGSVNVVRGPVRGIQIAGNVNVTGAFEGAQIAGNVNVSRDFTGVQLSGVVNVADGDVAGAQVGVLNVATGRVRGTQIGLVNIADSSDFSLGVVNINTEGRTHIDIWSELEVGMLFSAVKHGGEHWHYVYGVGTRLTDPNLMAVFGLGGHLRFADWFYLDLDTIAYLAPTLRNGALSTIAQARLLAGFNAIDELAFYVGPSFNTLIGHKGEADWAPGYSYFPATGGNDTVAMWPGATLGMQILSE
jgi:hypothetical protein